MMEKCIQDVSKKKFVVPERFVGTLKNKTYKYMTSRSKNVYIDKLDDTINEYKNTYHRTMKMKPVDVKSSPYIDFKYIYSHAHIFVTGFTPNQTDEIFAIKKVKNTIPRAYVIKYTN